MVTYHSFLILGFEQLLAATTLPHNNNEIRTRIFGFSQLVKKRHVGRMLRIEFRALYRYLDL